MRRILQILGVFIALIIVAVVGLVMFLPTGQIVQLAADQVKAQTGRDLAITGDISPSFYPVLGVEAEGITLSNADWAEAPHMVSAGSAKIGVKLFPLLSGSIQVEEVRLVEPDISLEIGEDGVPNWQFETAAATETTPQQSGAEGDGFVKELSFGETTITNGAVRFTDRTTQTSYELTAINAAITLDALDRPLAVEGDAVWNGQKVDLDLTLGTIATLTAGGETEIDLTLGSDVVNVAFKGAVIPPAPEAAIEAGGAFSISAPDPAAAMAWAVGEANPALVGLTELNVEGDVAVDATALAVDISGGVTRDGEAASIELKAAGGEAWTTARTFTVDLKAAIGALAELTFKGDLAAPDGADPTVKGTYAVASSSPAGVMKWALGAATPEVEGLSDLALAGDVDLGAAGVSVTGDGGVVRDGRRATVGLKANGGADWQTAMAFDVDAKLAVDGLATASYVGSVAAPPNGGPAVNGSYSLSAPSPAAAAAWATGAPADPGLADLTNVAIKGGVALSDKGLTASANGGASYTGQPATFDVSAKSGAGWEASRAFTINLTANGQGLGSVAFNGDVKAPDGAAPSVNGSFDVKANDLRALAKLGGAALPSNNPKAFRALSAKGSVSTPGANRLSVKLAALTFDAISASGDVAVDYGGALNINANLNTGPLDLNPYIVTGETAPAGPGWSKERIDLAGLSAINGDFKLRAKSVTAQNIKLGVSDIRARISGGKLTLNINELGLYGGGLKGDIFVDGVQNNALKANITASSVRILPMLKSLAGVDIVKGLGAMTINVTGGGASMHDIMNSLNGSGSMTLNNGAIVGYNLAAMVRNVQSAFTGGGGGSQQTDFSEVSGTFDIRQGLLKNADFQFLGPLIRIFGAGDIDLGGQSMKFRLTPKAVTSLKGQGGAADASGLSFPLMVTGPWNNLSIRPDLEGGIANLLKDPEGAINAVTGVVESLSNGAALEGAAGDALKAVTGAAAGGAALGGAKALLDAAKDGDAGGVLKSLSKATEGGSDPVSNVLKSLGGQQTKPAKPNPLKKINARIATAKGEMDAAKAAGDKKALKAARTKLKKLRARRDKLKAGG